MATAAATVAATAATDVHSLEAQLVETPPAEEAPPPSRVEAWAAGKDFRALVASLDEVGGIRARLASSYVPHDAKPAALDRAYKKACEHLHPDRLVGLPPATLSDVAAALVVLGRAHRHQAEVRRWGRATST